MHLYTYTRFFSHNQPQNYNINQQRCQFKKQHSLFNLKPLSEIFSSCVQIFLGGGDWSDTATYLFLYFSQLVFF